MIQTAVLAERTATAVTSERTATATFIADGLLVEKTNCRLCTDTDGTTVTWIERTLRTITIRIEPAKDRTARASLTFSSEGKVVKIERARWSNDNGVTLVSWVDEPKGSILVIRIEPE